MNQHGTSTPDLADLLPWRAWVHDRRLRTPAVALFATLVTVPSAGALIGSDNADLGLVVFALYFAAAWYLLLRTVIRPQHVSGADVVQVVVLALLTQKLLIFSWYDLAGSPDFGNLLSTTFGNGLPEEAVKLLPVVVLALVHRRAWSSREPRDLLFLGMVSGLVFGTSEAVFYVTDQYAGADATVFVWRLVDGPIGHACWAGISAYFLGLALVRHRRAAALLIALGLAVPATLHGLNNWDPVNNGVAWVGIALVSGLLVLGYAQVGVRAPNPVPVSPGRPTVEPDPVTERIVLPAHGTFVGPDGRLWG